MSIDYRYFKYPIKYSLEHFFNQTENQCILLKFLHIEKYKLLKPIINESIDYGINEYFCA